jgi:prevent-host-death family protein
MLEYNVHSAKTHFSKILAAVQRGEEVVIARAGYPIAVVKPYAIRKKRKLGLEKGKFRIAKDFDVLPKEMMDGFLGLNK